MLTNEVKNQLKDMSKDQLIEGMRKGEFNIPKEDRAEFFNFASKTPEERAASIQGGEPTIPVTPAEQSKDTQGGEGPKLPTQEAGGTPSTNNDPWVEFGYKTPVDAVEAHKSLLRSVASLNATIDGLNAKGGKVGQELKKLREERDELMKQVNASKPSVEFRKPEKPKRPKPEEFEDGILDEKYQKSLIEYEDAFERYTEELVEYKTSKNKEEVTAFVETKYKDSNPPSVEDDGFNDLFTNAIPKFQEKFNLTTVNSIKEISDAFTNSESSDPVRAARAKDFLSKVSPADMQKYDLVKDAVSIAYDFSGGRATPKYKTIEGALYDSGKLGDNSPYKPVIKQAVLTPEEERAAIERKTRENENSVSAIPASQTASSDPKLSSASTMDEKKARYKELTTDYNKAINSRGGKEAFEKTEKFAEWLALRKEVLNSTPFWR